MKIETLNDRIAKAEEKISKKQNTITKKTALIEKKKAQMAKAANENDRYWITCDMNWLAQDIIRLNREIKETENTLENYRKQLAGEIERQSTLIKEVPETLKRLQTELVEKWDGWDIEERNFLREKFKELGYSDFVKEYGWRKLDEKAKTDEQIHSENVRDAESAIINLLYRVKEITGEVTDWADIHLSGGVLNGIVKGKEGRCEVETIGAGGYNIQRYHLRVLVKPIN